MKHEMEKSVDAFIRLNKATLEARKALEGLVAVLPKDEPRGPVPTPRPVSARKRLRRTVQASRRANR